MTNEIITMLKMITTTSKIMSDQVLLSTKEKNTDILEGCQEKQKV